jgi:hypothetical protein
MVIAARCEELLKKYLTSSFSPRVAIHKVSRKCSLGKPQAFLKEAV